MLYFWFLILKTEKWRLSTTMNVKENSDNSHEENIVEEQPYEYYGTSTYLRESGIIPALKSLSREDTTWVIRFMQQHLNKISAKPDIASHDIFSKSLSALDQLGDAIRLSGKTSEQLINEHVRTKYSV